jgi:hypothetical protein
MSKDIKILNEVHKMKNLMKYMNGEKMSPEELKEGYYEESEIPLEEGVSDDYSRDVKVRINAYRAKFNGNDIDDVEVDSIKLSYAIDIEAREWGIKDISLYGIEGPSEIEGRAIYYPEGSDYEQEAMITLPLNWENVNIEKETGSGIITVGDEVEITLANNEKGELFVSEIMIQVYTL